MKQYKVDWESHPIELRQGNNPAYKIFRQLAVEAHKLMKETYERIYGEDFVVSDIVSEQAPDYHVYYKKDEEQPFFFMSRSDGSVEVDPLTGGKYGLLKVECRVPVQDTGDTAVP